MEATQFERDIARLEAHKLALKDDEFTRLTDLIRREVRAHERYLREDRGVPLKLYDRDSARVTVEHADGVRLTTITFDHLRHEIHGSNYVFTVEIDGYGRPMVTGRNFGQPLGAVDQDTIITFVRQSIDAITDLPRPIK